MDFLGKKCPVCENYFHEGDDVVVCPDCGTPHHRECYEKLNHCFYQDRHKDGFDYNDEADVGSAENICPNCGTPNEEGSFFCKHCGASLSEENTTYRQSYNTQQRSNENTNPYGQGNFQGASFAYDAFDPMAGVDKNEDFGDGVTAGETAKYVKQNTPYFIRIFHNLRTFSKSRFNFSAALFTGIYLMYRKMYKIGALITAIQLGLMILYAAILYSAPYQEIVNNMPTVSFYDMSSLTEFMNFSAGLSSVQVFMVYFLFAYDLIRVGLMVTIGFTFNRLYFSHCKKQIGKIKADSSTVEDADNKLQTKGGVNTAIAVAISVSFLAVNYLPLIIFNLF